MEVNGEYMAASPTVGGGRHARPPPLARAVCQLFDSGADMMGCKTRRCAGGVGVVCCCCDWKWAWVERRPGEKGGLVMAVETVAWSQRGCLTCAGSAPVRRRFLQMRNAVEEGVGGCR
jgi:hypothetical protein